MASLESSFSKEDREFYEREFAFFNEVTGISGTLRSVLHEPKEVKKQKIAEELRKIEVEVGVYLPSNPDGQVIGIDRNSGKPLPSVVSSTLSVLTYGSSPIASLPQHPAAV
jgi:phosphatidylinositol 4-kinase